MGAILSQHQCVKKAAVTPVKCDCDATDVTQNISDGEINLLSCSNIWF